MYRLTGAMTVLASLLLFGFVSIVSGQPATKENQPPLSIDGKTRTQVIEKVLQEIDENYVFPEVAEKMKQAIQVRVGKKEYDDVTTGQELAQRLTAHLQEVSKDKHLRVRYSAEKLAPDSAHGEPPPEIIAQRKRLTQVVNAGCRKVERMPGNVGYLGLDGFMRADVAAAPVAAAMTFLANTDALILDLRRNGGGSPDTVALVCSYFFDEKPIHLNSLYFRPANRTDDFWTREKLDGPRYVGKPVYVLTSKYTFSGAEECAYNLQTQKRATIVGETTGGGAHPGGTARINDHFLVFVPSGRAINPITKTNWEGTGVKPEIAVPADQALETAHQKAIDQILENAPNDDARSMIRDDIENNKRRERREKPADGFRLPRFL